MMPVVPLCALSVPCLKLLQPWSEEDSGIAEIAGAFLAKTAGRLDSEVSQASDVAHLLRDASGRILGLSDSATMSALAEDQPNTEQSREELVSGTDLALLGLATRPEMLEIFQRYDLYFGFRRYPHDDAKRRLRQSLETSAIVLADVSRAMMDLGEIAALVRAMSELFGEAPQPENSVDRRDATSTAETSDGANLRFDLPSATHPIREQALWRWKVGHQLFNQFVRRATSQVMYAASANSEDGVVGALSSAGVLLRGSTAAMWYAEAFPSKQYVEAVRPTMVEASGRQDSGFSGTDNLEFETFKVAVEELGVAIRTRFGADPLADWPREVWHAMWKFLGLRQLDLEHHTLIAEKVVGEAPSLKLLRTKELRGVGGDAGPSEAAVEQLRRLVETARSAKAEVAGARRCELCDRYP
jgi:hypothetical protein